MGKLYSNSFPLSNILLEIGLTILHVLEFYDLGDDLVHLEACVIEARNWRIGGGDGRVNMRTAMDCAWMLDGAMDNCVYALSLASRWYPSRFTEPFWNELKDFVSTESIRLLGEPIHICTEAKALHFKSILSPLFYKIITVSLGLRGIRGPKLGLRQQRTIGSSKCLWGFCFHVGQKVTSRLTVAAGGLLPTSRLTT
ncbi:hypothetical protein PIB30_047203 [Stylosanthes scabra]|uniref:Uncharacterized protein n=1 Tax=Stylosanthes scabra TaxID=79078 RepID=A0ABU6THQ1_9FABA|nr:hypothetical protein [Stylosanthes scabra]